MERYTRITLEEREKIYLLKKENYSQSEIAKKLGRHKSTISRELSLNSSKIAYLPDSAMEMSVKRRQHNKLTKLDKNPDLKAHIILKLKEDRWPPEAISARLKNDPKMPNISHETIYKFIYSKEGQKLKLYEALMYRRPKRQAKCFRRKRYSVPEEKRIENRPDFINERVELGHAEGDLTFFSGSNSQNVITAIERVSRMVKLTKNENKKSLSTINKLNKSVKELGCKSLTLDNGSEFAKYGSLELTGTKVYFCKPHSPWQKGSIERMHVFLHKYIPKKTNINLIGEEKLKWAENKLNNLPRKCLGYLTPIEFLDKVKIKNHVALAS